MHRETVPLTNSTSPLAAWLPWLSIAACALLTVLSFFKGFIYAINPYVHVYYVINYRDGLIRRGLLGEALSLFVDQSNLEDTIALAAIVYSATNVAVMLILFAWTIAIELRRRDLLATSLYALYAASQFIPTVAYDSGFLDAYDYLLLLLATIAFAQKQLLIAALIGSIAPFVHEAFVFLWLCPVALAWWFKPSPRVLVALCAPLITTAIVYWVPSPEAGIAQMQSAPLPDYMKDFVIAFQFSQTIVSSLYIVLWKIGHNLFNFLIAIGYFTVPALLLIVLYGRGRADGRAWAALGLATFLPLSLNLIAWDLSRLLAPASFFAMLAVLFMESVRPTEATPRWLPAGCWLAALALIQAPFVYGYATFAAIEDRSFVRDLPIARWVASGMTYYVRNIRPKVETVTGRDDPPGNVWYMEEDAWRGALIRRPGTNVFDATMTKGGMVVQYTAEIVRDGDRIFITRDAHDKKAMMTYVGTLRGNRVTGTYRGGIWGAIVLR
ncbi:hypothetical protein [Reyranella sp.]|uniref:hypothetical protein n=1 Tax=Reyranella sp. TaxID=1929291 RepID=UPI0037844E3C